MNAGAKEFLKFFAALLVSGGLSFGLGLWLTPLGQLAHDRGRQALALELSGETAAPAATPVGEGSDAAVVYGFKRQRGLVVMPTSLFGRELTLAYWVEQGKVARIIELDPPLRAVQPWVRSLLVTADRLPEGEDRFDALAGASIDASRLARAARAAESLVQKAGGK